MLRHDLLSTTMFTPSSLCSAEGDPPADGGGTGPAASSAPAGDPPKDTSVLSGASQAKDGEGETEVEKEGEEKPGDDKAGKPPANETPEQKTAREAKEAEDKTKKVEATLKGYDEKLKLPDGLAKDHPIAVEFFKDAAERGLSVEETQAMVTRMGPKLVEAINKPYDAWADLQSKWVKALPVDAEFGGKDYQSNLGIAALAMDEVLGSGTNENKAFREMLAFTGVGNNPEMMRFLFRVGKGIKEGAPIGGKSKVDQSSLAQKMYPTMAQTT
jgi:hypothetical protein